MNFDVLTLFPEMFNLFEHSIIGRAREKGIINIFLYNIRDYTNDKHRKVDDYPYGGGYGMVMQAEPIYNAVESVVKKKGFKPYTILLSPRGERYNQSIAKELSLKDNIMLICGHYEGIDERIMPLVDCEISIGDYILTGGELGSMVIIDSVSRLIPNVLSTKESYEEESFYSGLLEYPQYTRPEDFRGMMVPDVLLSGHHDNIRKWRRYQALKITLKRRPDLLKGFPLNKEDKKFLNEIKENLDK